MLLASLALVVVAAGLVFAGAALAAKNPEFLIWLTGPAGGRFALRILEQFTPAGLFWPEDGPPAELKQQAERSGILALAIASLTVVAQTLLAGAAALAFPALATRILARRPEFLAPLHLHLEDALEPVGRDGERRMLDSFAEPRRRRGAGRLYGLFGPEGVGAGYLAKWWLADLRWRWGRGVGWGWIVGELRRPPPVGWKPRRPMAVLVDARTATPEIWQAVTDLLKLQNAAVVRILVVARTDLKELIQSLDEPIASSLDNARFQELEASQDAPADRRLLRIVSQRGRERGRGLGERTDASPPGKPDFLCVPRLERPALLKIARQYLRGLPRKLTDVDIEVAVEAASGLPGDLKRALGQIARGERIDHSRKYAKSADQLIDRACETFPHTQGLYVAALAALGAVEAVSSSVRLELAPAAGDRLALRNVLAGHGPFEDEEQTPAIRDRHLAWEVLLQALTRLQSADRQRFLAKVSEAAPSLLPTLAQEMSVRPDFHDGLAIAIAGPAEARNVARAQAGDFLMSPNEVARTFAAVLHAAAGSDGLWPDAIAKQAEQLAPVVAARIKHSSSYLLNQLGRQNPRIASTFEIFARSPVWAPNGQAIARFLAGYFDVDDPTGDWRPGDGDPVAPGLKAWNLLNEVFRGFDAPRSDEKFQRYSQAALDLVALMDAELPERLLATWASAWLLAALSLDAPFAELPEPLISALERVVIDEKTDPDVWRFAARCLGKMAAGHPDDRDPVYQWALWFDGQADKPEIAPPLRLTRFSRSEILEEASSRLKSPNSDVAVAAALLLCVYIDDIAALDVLADALVDQTLHVDRRDMILLRLVQVGAAAEAPIARAFKACGEEAMRARIFLGLMALDFGPSLSDEDIRATAEDAEFFIETRNSMRLRQANASEAEASLEPNGA
ncbi:MAG: hypothetical protein ACK5WW_13150 [Brevundimonas sp.]|uniref:hypothetical protein n=1 Tax=Brevundimonas sp. TaxID=1871086 RepID=UPI00391C7F79